MKKNDIAIIKAALDRSLMREDAAIVQSIDSLESPSDEFFKRLDEKFEKIRADQKKRPAVRKVIAAAIAATLIFALLACASITHRDAIKDFFVDIFDTHSKLTDKDITNAIPSNVSVSYIPNGFIEINKKIDSSSAIYEWKMENSSIFLRARAKGNSFLKADTEDSSYATIQINDSIIHRTEKHGQIDARWTDEKMVYILTTTGVEWEEMVKIIEGVAYQDANG